MSAFAKARVRVVRNPLHTFTTSLGDDARQRPWLVYCGVCDGTGGGVESLFYGACLGWAATWEIAQSYAIKHANQHVATACDSCQRPYSLTPERASP